MVKNWLKGQKNRFKIFAFFGTLIILMSIYFLPMNLPHRVSRAQQLIDEMYVDDQKVFLSDKVTAYKVQEALNIVNRLSGETGDKLRKEIETIHVKFRNFQIVDELVQESYAEIMDPTLKTVTFDPNLEFSKMADRKGLYFWTEKDAFTEQIDYVHGLIQSTWQPIAEAHEALAQLPKEISKDNEQLSQDLDKLIEINGVLSSIDKEAYGQKLKKTHQTLIDDYLKQMQAQEEKSSFNDTIFTQLYKNDIFFKKIEGTKLDHRPKVALTFDDGPNEDFTPQVLDILDKHQVKATFFVVGRDVDNYPHIAQEIVERGHDIGNHSYSHPTFLEMTDDEVLWEINATQDIIENHTGYRPSLYRMPFGDGGERVYKLIDNMTSTMWNIDTNDWYFDTPQEIYDYTRPQFDKDMLILMHDTSQKSVDAFEIIIESLIEERYVFVHPDQLEYKVRYREL